MKKRFILCIKMCSCRLTFQFTNKNSENVGIIFHPDLSSLFPESQVYEAAPPMLHSPAPPDSQFFENQDYFLPIAMIA
ncbi:MAG: hypothetical protein ACLUN0_02595 [Roseburia sp.]